MIKSYENYILTENFIHSLEEWCDLLAEKTKDFNEYKNNNYVEYKKSVNLGKTGWVTPICLDNCFFEEIEKGFDAEHFLSTNPKEFENEVLTRNLDKEIIKKIDDMKLLNNNIYYLYGKKNYEEKDYFSTALCILPLLEEEVSVLFKKFGLNSKMKNKEKYSEENFDEWFGKLFNCKIKDKISKNVIFIHILPSLCSYMNMMYIEKKEEWENEPNILKRNILMHGKSKRQIKKIECVQLFNALFSVEFIISIL